MTRTLRQQGDVLFHSERLPDSVTPSPRRVLAEGEATGHAHRLTAESDVEVYEDAAGVLWLRVGPGGATVVHEEHAPVTLGEGEIRVGRVQEYDHFAEDARRVQD